MKVHGRLFLQVLLAGLLLCFATAVEAADVNATIKMLIEEHTKAVGKKDLEAVMRMYAPSPKATLMGSGQSELYMGKEEIAAAHRGFFQSYDRQDITITWSSIESEGNMAWVLAMCDVKAQVKKETITFPVNVSAVLKKQGENWLFVTVHLSNPYTVETEK